jgi:DNA adenine methylase
MKNYRYLSSTALSNSKPALRGIKAPFKWAGAKNRMFARYMGAGFFTSSQPKVFVDMFAGTGIVGQWVASNYPNTTIILNETCSEIVNMYRRMQSNSFSQFEKEYKKHVTAYCSYSTVEDRKKHYYGIRDRYALSYHNMSPVEEAASLFYMLQTGFNGIWQTSDNFNNRYASPAGLMTWKPNGKLFDMCRIKKYAEFIDRCVLLNDDFEKTQCFIGSDTWFYADPPYRKSFATYDSAGSFTDYDQVRLCNFLKTAHKSGDIAALSNREDPEIDFEDNNTGSITKGYFSDKFNDDWNVRYFKVKYTAGRHNKGQKGEEVLIKNY